MNFQPWSDFKSPLATLQARQNARRLKATQDADYRDKRAQTLEILLTGIKKTNDLKVHMNACQAMTDEIMQLLYTNQNLKTEQDNSDANK